MFFSSIGSRIDRPPCARTGRVNGRHMFFSHQAEDSMTSMPQDPVARLEESRRRMSAHGHELRALTPLERVPFERNTIEHGKQRTSALVERTATLRAGGPGPQGGRGCAEQRQ